MGESAAGGYLNSGGYQEYKGYNKRAQTDGGSGASTLEWISGPSPETLFKRDQTQPAEIPIKLPEPCKDIGLDMAKILLAFTQGPQNGYKTAGFTENNLTGYRDFSNGLCSTEPRALPHITGAPEAINIDAVDINTESSRFRWGNRDLPANYGSDLPGSMQILQKGHMSGPQIWLEKAKGYNGSRGSGAGGHYAGWDAAKWADNGMISNGVNT